MDDYNNPNYTIDDKYKIAYKILLETRDQLEHLESGGGSDLLQGTSAQRQPTNMKRTYINKY